MAAHRQAVDHELILIHKLGHDLFHHLLVRGREILLVDLHIQSVADAVIFVAHIGVREVAVVVIVEIVVIGQGAVPQIFEQGAKAEGHVVVRRLRVTPHPRLGNETRGGHILPVRGGHTPQGRIEVVADNSLMGQLPQGGSTLGIHSQGGKSFCHHPDQIFSCKAARPFIFRRRFHFGEVLVHVGKHRIVLVPLQQGVKVDLHHMQSGLLLLLQLVGCGSAHRKLGQDLVIRIDPKEHPPDLQLGLGNHTEVLYLQLRRGRLEVDIPQRQVPPAAQQHQEDPHHLYQRTHAKPAQPVTPGQRLTAHDPVPEHQGQHHRHHHHQNGKPVHQDLAHRHIAEGSGHHGHFGDGKDGQKGFEQMVVDDLRAHPQGEQGGTYHYQPPSPPLLHAAAQQSQQHRHRNGEQQGKKCPGRGQAMKAEELHKQLFIINNGQEKGRGHKKPPPALDRWRSLLFFF